MEIETYFFDTYAFYEIIEGNLEYKPYTKDVAVITTKLNLMELYYGLFILYGKETAEKYFDEFVEYCIDIDDTTIKQAMEFRSLHKRRNLSYIDCLGYILAKNRNIKFLTGDKEFSEFDNVKFVK